MNYFIEFKMLVTNLMANHIDLDFLRRQCAATRLVQNVEESDVDAKRILLERNQTVENVAVGQSQHMERSVAPMGEKLHASYKNVSRTYIVMISATLLQNTTVIKCIPEVNRNKANSFHFVQQLIQCSYPVSKIFVGVSNYSIFTWIF